MTGVRTFASVTDVPEGPGGRLVRATREDVDLFCENEGWQLVLGSKGRPVARARTYDLELWDGAILIARIAPSSAGTSYSPKGFEDVLTQNLKVDESTFWACVTRGVKPDRGTRAEQRPGLPYYLLEQLISLVGVQEREAAALSETQARERLARFWQTVGAGSKTLG